MSKMLRRIAPALRTFFWLLAFASLLVWGYFRDSPIIPLALTSWAVLFTVATDVSELKEEQRNYPPEY